MVEYTTRLAPAEAVKSLRDLAAQGFVGVRFNPYLWPHEMCDAVGSAIFQECGALGLPVGVMAFNGLLPLAPSLKKLMQLSPATTVVLDHFGFPRSDPASPPDGQPFDEEAWASAEN